MKKIVTVGGGNGSHAVLSGLKNLKDVSLTALVSMADDGGSTGVLRKKWGVMPPGDVRQCLAALSGKEFLNKRSRILFGHKRGNVILAILEKVTGDFSRSLKVASWVFGAKGKILPITKDNAILEASFADGRTVTGEGNIDREVFTSEVENLHYTNSVKINPEAREALIEADYIIIPPGNLFCSILPNFIVEGFKETLRESRAKTILIMNLVNRQGHTMGWGKEKYLRTIEEYLGKPIDFVLDNNEQFTSEQAEYYRKETINEVFLKDDLMGARIIKTALLSPVLSKDSNDGVKRSLIRHDPHKLAKAIEKIIN